MGRIEPEITAALGNLSVYRSEAFFIEIMPENIDKAISLQKLCEYAGVAREELAACGDGYNDMPMIRFAGLGDRKRRRVGKECRSRWSPYH